MSQDLVLNVWCLCQQHQQHLGTLRSANSWPSPGLLGLMSSNRCFNNPPDDCDAQGSLRDISPGYRRVEDPNEVRKFMTGSLHPTFYSNFTFHFVFKGKAQKKYDSPDSREEKTGSFSQDQAETSGKVCTSYKTHQLHFQEASYKDDFPPWQ